MFLRSWLLFLFVLLSASGGAFLFPPKAEARANYFLSLYFRSTPLTNEEKQALRLVSAGKMAEARKLLGDLLRKNPEAFLPHFLLGYVYRYAEGELIRALWHMRQALQFYQERGLPVLSEARQCIMQELIFLLRQLGREEEALKQIDQFNRLYGGRSSLTNLKPWSLMRLRRYDEATAMAREMLKGNTNTATAYNTLCAITFERGQRLLSLSYCRAAFVEDEKSPDVLDRVVHRFNLAEAHLGLMQFEEAEQRILEATKYFHRSHHTSPWEFLNFMYLDQGRYDDAFNALKGARSWFYRRDPHLSESLFANYQLSQANFFLAAAKPDLALQSLERIRDRPDRQGHSSSQTEQQVAGTKLMLRHARLLQAEILRESIPALPWYGRPVAHLRRLWLGLLAWRDGSQARRSLSKGELLPHTLSFFRAGRSEIPHWMTPDLIELVGPAVVRKHLASLRDAEIKEAPLLASFLDFLEVEVLMKQGRHRDASALLERNLKSLPQTLKPLHYRLMAYQADFKRRQNDVTAMRSLFARLLMRDGSIFRRLSIPIPLADIQAQDPALRPYVDVLFRSPRFEQHPHGFHLQLSQVSSVLRLRLLEPGGSVLSQAAIQAKPKEEPKAFFLRAVQEIHQALFAPPMSLAREGITSLDDNLQDTSSQQILWKDLVKDLSQDKPKKEDE